MEAPKPSGSAQRYHRRSESFRLAEERQYNIGMAKMLADRGFLHLAYSHLLYADDVGFDNGMVN